MKPLSGRFSVSSVTEFSAGVYTLVGTFIDDHFLLFSTNTEKTVLLFLHRQYHYRFLGTECIESGNGPLESAYPP